MAKLKLLVITLLLSLTAFSQTDTSKSKGPCTLVIPYETAQKIAIDLVRGDSAKAELVLTQDALYQTEQKVVQQQTIMEAYAKKESLYKQEINLYLQKEEKYSTMVTGLEKSNKRLKVGVKVLGVSIGAAVITAILSFAIH
jgi:hypothetical protein